jgi:hypothetical protein
MQTDYQDIDQLEETQESAPRAVPFAAIAKIKHIQADNVYIKTTFVPQHVKFYNKRTPDTHVAILAHGEILMDDGETQTRFRAPANYVIPANHRFSFYTIKDCVFYCVHATPETDLEKLDQIY